MWSKPLLDRLDPDHRPLVWGTKFKLQLPLISSRLCNKGMEDGILGWQRYLKQFLRKSKRK